MQAGVDPMLGFRDLDLDADAESIINYYNKQFDYLKLPAPLSPEFHAYGDLAVFPFVSGLILNEHDIVAPPGVKPCKCGGFDHKRVSYHLCPLYQGKIRDRYKIGDHEETECCIKLGLANFLHPALSANQKKQLNASIQDAVHRITDIFAEASTFLSGFVLWALESGHSIPDLRYSDGIMAQVFQAIQQKETKAPYSRKKVASSLLNLYADTVYAQFRPKQVAWCDAPLSPEFHAYGDLAVFPFVSGLILNEHDIVAPPGVKPCKCGGFDHKRVSHHLCPLYQGKIRDRYKIGDHEETECCIKLGLANFLHPALSANQKKQLNASIQDAVHRITDVYAEASRFLSGFVLWALESWHSIPDLRYSDGVMVQLGLANFLHPALSANQKKQLNASIQDAVPRITDVYAEASRFLSGFVLWALESGHSIPDLRYSDGVMVQVFQAIQQKDTKAPFSRKKVASSLLNVYADTLYAQFRPKQVAWCDGSLLSYSINALSKQYAVNCMVHIKTNIKRCLKQVVKFRLEQKLNGHISIKSFNLLLEYLMRQLSRYDSQYNVVRFPLEIFPLDGSWNIDFSSPLYETIVTAVSDVWSEALLNLENQNITTKYVNKEWWNYIRPMYKLLQ
ncbi:hypothetical protein MP638_007234, partial [Amoeboaphelidium occidentale]